MSKRQLLSEECANVRAEFAAIHARITLAIAHLLPSNRIAFWKCGKPEQAMGGGFSPLVCARHFFAGRCRNSFGMIPIENASKAFVAVQNL
jgi:hypothetical protein